MSEIPAKDIVVRSLATTIPSDIISAAERLGYDLYAVGGCVRDPLLNKEIGDVDFAVVGDATRLAQDVAATANASQVTIYTRFGTAMVIVNGRRYEFATARAESYQPDSRKPVDVVPVTIEADLKRRDFTINALAVGLAGSRRGEFLDLFDGLDDLAERRLRTPLNPDVTFADDPLRMLRAVRFAANLGFEISPETFEGMRRQSHRLKIVASERMGDEFYKMLAGANPVRAMELLLECNLMPQLLPEVTAMAGVDQVNRHHHKDVLKHSLKVMQGVAAKTADPIVRLAGLLHDVGKPRTKRFDPEVGWSFYGHEVLGAKMAWQIARRLSLGHDRAQRLTQLIRHHMRPINLTSEGVTDSAIRRLMADLGDALDDQMILCRADITTANPKRVVEYLANFDDMVQRMGDVEARDKMRNFQSPVRGEEIMALCGIPAGPLVGALKERIEDAILDGIIPHDYDSAKNYLLEVKDEVLSLGVPNLDAERRRRADRRRSVTSDFVFPDQAGITESNEAVE